MTEDKNRPTPEAGDHDARIRDAFASLREKLGRRLDPEAGEYVRRLRESAARKDAEGLRRDMSEVREKHGWLYQELAEHPEIANLLDELALWGF